MNSKYWRYFLVVQPNYLFEENSQTLFQNLNSHFNQFQVMAENTSGLLELTWLKKVTSSGWPTADLSLLSTGMLENRIISVMRTEKKKIVQNSGIEMIKVSNGMIHLVLLKHTSFAKSDPIDEPFQCLKQFFEKRSPI